MAGSWRYARATLRKTLWTIPVLVTVNDCVCGQAVVAGRSMQPTFNPPHSRRWRDRVLADKLSIRLYRYRRGDVVLLRAPDQPEVLLVKRLLALEGDLLAVPGRPTIEKIPKGQCWVEGDNPELSEDSRTKYGPVPLALVEGRVTHIIWPPSRVGRVSSRLPPGRLLAKGMYE